MSKIEKVIRELSDLFDFYQKIGKLKRKSPGRREGDRARPPVPSNRRTAFHR